MGLFKTFQLILAFLPVGFKLTEEIIGIIIAINQAINTQPGSQDHAAAVKSLTDSITSSKDIVVQ